MDGFFVCKIKKIENGVKTHKEVNVNLMQEYAAEGNENMKIG